MDHIKEEKLQAMNKYKKTTQFLSNLILCSFTALTCVLFCSSPLWLPPIYSFVNLFLFVYIPNMRAYIFNPKCLFIVCNIIVVFLIGESKLVGSNSSSPSTDIYDEYVNRSVSLRKVSSHVEKKVKDVLESEENVKRDDEEETEGEKEGGEEMRENDLEVEEKLGLPVEELNRKVEDFIAKVNKQRKLEARLLFCTSEREIKRK